MNAVVLAEHIVIRSLTNSPLKNRWTPCPPATWQHKRSSRTR